MASGACRTPRSVTTTRWTPISRFTWPYCTPTRNRFFYSLRYMIEVALRFSIRISNQVKGVNLASIEEHERILEAIAAGDAELAESRMRTLILDAREFLERANELRNGADDGDLEARSS